MLNKKNIDCGINKLSELTRISMNRLVAKETMRGETLFDVFTFESNLREAIKKSLRGEVVKERFIFFFLNDKKKVKKFDFFKILLIEFTSKMQVQRTDICHFEGNPTANEKSAIFDDDFSVEASGASMLNYDPDFTNQIEVDFESEVNLYNIQSKTLLAIY